MVRRRRRRGGWLVAVGGQQKGVANTFVSNRIRLSTAKMTIGKVVEIDEIVDEEKRKFYDEAKEEGVVEGGNFLEVLNMKLEKWKIKIKLNKKKIEFKHTKREQEVKNKHW